jgi:hypothetical protein
MGHSTLLPLTVANPVIASDRRIGMRSLLDNRCFQTRYPASTYQRTPFMSTAGSTRCTLICSQRHRGMPSSIRSTRISAHLDKRFMALEPPIFSFFFFNNTTLHVHMDRSFPPRGTNFALGYLPHDVLGCPSCSLTRLASSSILGPLKRVPLS